MKITIISTFVPTDIKISVESAEEMSVLRAIFAHAQYELVSKQAQVSRAVSDTVIEKLHRAVNGYQ
jgi:hypothetical protein